MTESLYFLVEEGPIKSTAERYRKDTIAYRTRVFKYLGEIGATGYKEGFRGGIGSVRFDGNPPEGFTKPNRHGDSFPKKKSRWEAEFSEYNDKPQVEDYLSGIVVPTSDIIYKYKSGRGSRGIGNLMHPYGLYWYSAEGPILLITPDVQSAVTTTKSNHPDCVIENYAESWKPPEGVREILKEEWDLMVARHKKATP